MTTHVVRAVSLGVVLCSFSAMAQTAPAKVDFARDIQPLLKQNCVKCHGAEKQSGGLRLDQRGSTMKPGLRRVVAGSPENSMVYHRIIGEMGQPMPPTGDLKPNEVALIRRWIEEGAEWPDALANETPLPPIDPEAVALVELMRTGNSAAVLQKVAAKPSLLNARGSEGSTPFMYAVLYEPVPVLEKMIALGANVNAANDNHGTALLWAAHYLPKTKLLVEHGANVNAKSDDYRTPLMVAARTPGAVAVVRYLLEHSAEVNPNPHAGAQSSPLLEAATAPDAASFALLLEHGATIKNEAQSMLSTAMYTGCIRCVDLIVERVKDKDVYTGSLQDTALFGDVRVMQMMLDRGADVKAFDVLGRTALMYAAQSDTLPLDAVKLLVEHGADVNARSKHTKGGDESQSVLDIALKHGRTPVSDYLISVGAKTTEAGMPPKLDPRFRGDLKLAVTDNLPMLQKSDRNFAKLSGCISCHNNSLTAMTVGMARKRGLPVDEAIAQETVHANVEALKISRDIMHEGFLLPVGDNFSENVWAYVLLGLAAEGYKADLNTDTAAMYILARQQPTGEWVAPHADTRQPICLDYVANTALALRALQLYAPKTDAAVYKHSVAMAAKWLETAQSENNEDRSWRLLGLAWAGTTGPALEKAKRELLAAQKTDGGWSELPSMPSNAYSTGKSLVALRTAGVPISSAAYQRGVTWLRTHQDRDGSWVVETRAMAFQPAFDAGFSHGPHQFVSAAGTGWADMALMMAMPERRPAKAVNQAVAAQPLPLKAKEGGAVSGGGR